MSGIIPKQIMYINGAAGLTAVPQTFSGHSHQMGQVRLIGNQIPRHQSTDKYCPTPLVRHSPRVIQRSGRLVEHLYLIQASLTKALRDLSHMIFQAILGAMSLPQAPDRAVVFYSLNSRTFPILALLVYSSPSAATLLRMTPTSTKRVLRWSIWPTLQSGTLRAKLGCGKPQLALCPLRVRSSAWSALRQRTIPRMKCKCPVSELFPFSCTVRILTQLNLQIRLRRIHKSNRRPPRIKQPWLS